MIPTSKTFIRKKIGLNPRKPRNINLPKNFDGRIAWKKFLSPVKSQGNCGACYAFASASVLSDRFNIQSRGQVHIDLSPGKIISCDFDKRRELKISPKTAIEIDSNSPKCPSSSSNKLTKAENEASHRVSCTGNSILDTLEYLYTIGTNLEECFPNIFFYGSQNKTCTQLSGCVGDMCTDWKIQMDGLETGKPARFYRAYSFYLNTPTVQAIKEDIFLWGPVLSVIKINEKFDFVFNKEKPYKHKKNGGNFHSIEIVGWTNAAWIVKNSWGKNWGHQGYFYVDIEDRTIKKHSYGIVPDLFYDKNYNFPYYLSHGFYSKKSKNISAGKSSRAMALTAGGINRQYGYTRRILLTRNVSRIKIDIPDWENFIAAKGETLFFAKSIKFLLLFVALYVIFRLFILFYK